MQKRSEFASKAQTSTGWTLLSLDLVNMGVDGWMDGWIMCEQETLFSLGSSSLANQSGQLGLVL
jgi:hypothetical protein